MSIRTSWCRCTKHLCALLFIYYSNIWTTKQFETLQITLFSFFCLIEFVLLYSNMLIPLIKALLTNNHVTWIFVPVNRLVSKGLLLQLDYIYMRLHWCSTMDHKAAKNLKLNKELTKVNNYYIITKW